MLEIFQYLAAFENCSQLYAELFSKDKGTKKSRNRKIYLE